MQFLSENNEIDRFQLLGNVFNRLFLFHKRLIRFFNDLKINVFCRSLLDSSINFRKPPFR